MDNFWRWRHTNQCWKKFKLPPGSVTCWWNL